MPEGTSPPKQTKISKNTLKRPTNRVKFRKVGVFRSELRFPTMSEKRLFFALFVRLNAFSPKKRV
jgi:hypothetical protein